MGWMALLDDDDKEIGVTGDEPWDEASVFVDAIFDLYKKHWNREPTLNEVLSSVEFVYNGRIHERSKSL